LFNDHAVEASVLTLTLLEVAWGVVNIVMADGVHVHGELGFIYATMVFGGCFLRP